MIESRRVTVGPDPVQLCGGAFGFAAYPVDGADQGAWPLEATVDGGDSVVLTIRPGVFYQFDVAVNVMANTANGSTVSVDLDRARSRADFVNQANQAAAVPVTQRQVAAAGTYQTGQAFCSFGRPAGCVNLALFQIAGETPVTVHTFTHGSDSWSWTQTGLGAVPNVIHLWNPGTQSAAAVTAAIGLATLPGGGSMPWPAPDRVDLSLSLGPVVVASSMIFVAVWW